MKPYVKWIFVICFFLIIGLIFFFLSITNVFTSELGYMVSLTSFFMVAFFTGLTLFIYIPNIVENSSKHYKRLDIDYYRGRPTHDSGWNKAYIIIFRIVSISIMLPVIILISLFIKRLIFGGV